MVGECRALGVVVVVTVLAHLADSDPGECESQVSGVIVVQDAM